MARLVADHAGDVAVASGVVREHHVAGPKRLIVPSPVSISTWPESVMTYCRLAPDDSCSDGLAARDGR